MPELPTLKIDEIFRSFQGEGLRLGFPSIFIRLAGCRLRCPYCDTGYARYSEESIPVADSVNKIITVPAIMTEIAAYNEVPPKSQVVITGGEPLEQDISHLVRALKEEKFFTAIETNGLHFQPLPIDWWAVSPKDVAGYHIHPDLIKQQKINEIKLIVNENLTLEVIASIRRQSGIGEAVPVFLQPESNDHERFKNTFDLFLRCRDAGLDNIRAGIQLHKIYNVE